MPVALFDAYAIRQQFPALQKNIDGQPVTYLDAPGGTQVPQSVVDAMVEYLIRDNSNRGGEFLNSQRTDVWVSESRRAVADLLNARRPEEIVFGQNMTTLTFQISRALSRTWASGDEIILSKIDHNANIDPWLHAAADRGVKVRWLPIDPEDFTLQLDRLGEMINKRTKLVAITYASNAVGSITDVARVTQTARQYGAITYIDAVHYAPHGPIDVQQLDCDFLVSSAYKYFGPHIGVLYGRYELLDMLNAYKVRAASNRPPDKWETGTLSFESMAGVRAAIDYLASLSSLLGDEAYQTSSLRGRRLRVRRGMKAIANYEASLCQRFLEGAKQIRGLELFGITDMRRIDERTPTFAIRLKTLSPRELNIRLSNQGVYAWAGHFYALTLMENMELMQEGGVVRLGFCHYNLHEEVDFVLNLLERYAR